MNFISWLVLGVLFMLAEISSGSLYLLAIGIAFIYPAIGDLMGAGTDTQLSALGAGTVVHVLAVMIWRKSRPASPSATVPSGVGETVEVIEWIDECSARVKHRGKIWEADKVRAEMPNASHGIIKSVQGSRLIISTESGVPD